MGALAEGGVQVLSDNLIRDLGIPEQAIQQVAVRERLELDRRDTLYRQGRARPPIQGRVVIVVDDGLATGATMEAAVARSAHLVGSLPGGDADDAMRVALTTLGSSLRTLPDGETGERHNWIIHIIEAMRSFGHTWLGCPVHEH